MSASNFVQETKIQSTFAGRHLNQAERHFEAWQDLVCILSGLPLLPTGVSSGKFGAR